MTQEETALALEALRAENEKKLAEMRAEIEALKGPKGPDPPKLSPYEEYQERYRAERGITEPFVPEPAPWHRIGWSNWMMDRIAQRPNSQTGDMVKVRDHSGRPAGVDRRDGMKEQPALPTVRVIC